MTDNELLLAISNIVQSYTNPIQQQLQDAETRLDTRIDTLQSHLEGRIDSVQTYLEGRIDSVQTYLEGRIDSVQTYLEGRIDSVQTHLEGRIDSAQTYLEGRIDSVQADLEGKIISLDSEIKHTQSDVKQIRILLENDVLPRLQNIESCYTSTYQRYADNVLQIETLQSDVNVLKNVVAEHSEILRKIS